MLTRIKTKKRNLRLWILGIAVLLTSILIITMALVAAISQRDSERFEEGYTVIRSPNYDTRPLFRGVDCVVLHATATRTAGEAINTFLKPSSHVSAHFIVDRSGKITQMVPIGKRAWHAGVSRLGNQNNVNNFSVGIEIVNRNDGHQLYTDSQYKAVASLICHLREKRGINIDPKRIVSHREIALPVGRKSDPRGFDFTRLQHMLENR